MVAPLAAFRWQFRHFNWTGATFAALLILFFLGVIFKFTPPEATPWFTALIGAGLALVPISFVQDPKERTILLRFFFIAYVLRLVFTFVLFKSDLIMALGGADDLGWKGSAAQARRWNTWDPYLGMYGLPNPDKTSFADSFLGIFTDTKINTGYLYLGSVFYYYMGANNQMALAFLNCWGSALTVVMIYKAAQLFASRQAAIWIASFAVVLPGFLIWAALTQKEAWVILFQITGFYALWKMLYSHGPTRFMYVLLFLSMVVLVAGFRFYIAYVQLLAAALTILCFRSKYPLRSAVLAVGSLAVVAGGLVASGVVRLDLAGMVASQIDYVENFRAGIHSGPNSASSIQLDYDLHTWQGFCMMLLVGFAYVMFAPFVWQISTARQAAALPDVFIWYFLLFGFVIPGAFALWNSKVQRKNQAAVLSVLFFLLPLIFVYSISFSNVGLSFRLRAQFIPLTMIFAAAGYDRLQARRAFIRQRRRAKLQRALELALIDESIKSLSPAPRALPASLSHEKAA